MSIVVKRMPSATRVKSPQPACKIMQMMRTSRVLDAEIHEVYDDGFGVDVFGFFQELPQTSHQLAQVGTAGFVANAQRDIQAALFCVRPVQDMRGGQLAVGHDDERLIQLADARRPNANVFDNASRRWRHDEFAHAERFIGDDGRESEEVLYGIFRRQ